MIGIVRSQDPSIPKKLHFYRKEKEIIERDKEFAENVTISNAQEPSNNENDFSLTFKKKTQECEIEKWLNFENATLNDSPIMKEIHLKYNTSLCSQACVERSFNFAKSVYGLQRRSLSDARFEKQVILKANRKLNPKLFDTK